MRRLLIMKHKFFVLLVCIIMFGTLCYAEPQTMFQDIYSKSGEIIKIEIIPRSDSPTYKYTTTSSPEIDYIMGYIDCFSLSYDDQTHDIDNNSYYYVKLHFDDGTVLQFGFGFKVNYGFAVIYGMFGSLAAVFGDLCFSAIKRQTGIKDYGNLIPGHGGVLDRFDSMTIVAPLVELLMSMIPVAVKLW